MATISLFIFLSLSLLRYIIKQLHPIFSFRQVPQLEIISGGTGGGSSLILKLLIFKFTSKRRAMVLKEVSGLGVLIRSDKE
jgi:hypothetical protein